MLKLLWRLFRTHEACSTPEELHAIELGWWWPFFLWPWLAGNSIEAQDALNTEAHYVGFGLLLQLLTILGIWRWLI